MRCCWREPSDPTSTQTPRASSVSCPPCPWIASARWAMQPARERRSPCSPIASARPPRRCRPAWSTSSSAAARISTTFSWASSASRRSTASPDRGSRSVARESPLRQTDLERLALLVEERNEQAPPAVPEDDQEVRGQTARAGPAAPVDHRPPGHLGLCERTTQRESPLVDDES